MHCVSCKVDIERLDLLQCSGCKECYHYRCLNVTGAAFREKKEEIKRTITCETCSNITRRIRKMDDTPVRATAMTAMTGVAMEDDTSKENPSFTGIESTKSEKKMPNFEEMFDMPLFIETVNKAVSTKIDSLEKKLVNEIKEAIFTLSAKESDRLRKELKETQEKCMALQASAKESGQLRKELEEAQKKCLALQASGKESDRLREELKVAQAKCLSLQGEVQALKNEPKQATKKPQPPVEYCAGVKSSGNLTVKSSDGVDTAATSPTFPTRPPMSYAGVARSTKAADKEEQPIDQKANCIEVKSNKKEFHPVKKGENTATLRIKAVERKKFFHVWRLVSETTEEDLLQYVREVLGSESFVKVDRIKHKSERGYASFRICVSEGNFEKLCDPDIWPRDTEYSEWIWFRDSTNKPQPQRTD